MSGYLCDVNVWLALALSGHIHHTAVRGWLETVEEAKSIFFCRNTQQSLLRLLTNRSVLGPYGIGPLSNQQAWETYEALLGDDRIGLLAHEPGGLEQAWKAFAVRDTASPKLWMDAYLAAFSREGSHKLVTTDAAFRQFPGIDLVLLGGMPENERKADSQVVEPSG